jgi:AraC-like DNA-binding protein
MAKKLFRFLWILGILIILGSCQQPQEQNLKPIEVAPHISQTIDSLELLMRRYYVSNPDSAEIILFKSLRFVDSVGIPQKKFYVHMHLAQLYQYRIPNFCKALANLGEALEIFVKYPASYNSNCYVYIDIGNLFYHYRFYDQAKNFYQIAKQFAAQNNDYWGQALAWQNISLTYQQQQLFDSAYVYLQKADTLVRDKNDLMLAKNYTYLATLSLHRKDTLQFKNLKRFSTKSIELYNNYLQTLADSVKDIVDLTWIELMARNHCNSCSYHYINGDIELSRKHLAEASKYAVDARSPRLIAETKLLALMHNHAHLNNKDLEWEIASLHDMILKINNMSLQKEFSDSIVMMLSQRNQIPLKSFYEDFSNQIADSIIQQKLSNEFSANIMLMSRVAAEYTLQRLQLLQLLKTETIKNQTRIITSISVLAALIILSLLIFLFQKHKIDRANRAMFEKIQKDIRVTERNSVVGIGRGETLEKLEEKLESVITTLKPYLKKDLALYELAAMVNTNQTYLSNYLNQVQQTNFNDYVNQYRVKEACRLMLDHQQDNLTIEMLAGISGFNSTSTFYTAFKKFTGMSPIAFKKNR